jgi:hypothetical protein
MMIKNFSDSSVGKIFWIDISNFFCWHLLSFNTTKIN